MIFHRVQLLDQGQVLQINYVTQWDEGMYECVSENKAGNTRAKTMVQLMASAQNDSLYANISIPGSARTNPAVFYIYKPRQNCSFSFSHCCNMHLPCGNSHCFCKMLL